MNSGNYFVAEYETDKHYDDGSRLIVVLYFALTIISTVGYGDKTPVSNIERISVIIFMIIGVLLFSYYITMFLNMIVSFDKQMFKVRKDDELAKWLENILIFKQASK